MLKIFKLLEEIENFFLNLNFIIMIKNQKNNKFKLIFKTKYKKKFL